MHKREKIIVTCAIPYANGPLHIGHLAGCYVPGDIYVRFKRLQGHEVHFACGTDEHGAGITILAIRENTTPQAIVDKYYEILKQDFVNCDIDVDVFSRTTRPFHYKRSQEFFLNALKNGYIEKKTEARLYCSSCDKFLPDRYVLGECPKCHSANARGDQCEKCGSWYEPEELINPICQICKVTKATLKPTSHWYIALDKLEAPLTKYLTEKEQSWRRNVMGYAWQPLKAGLQPRSITRDLDWGVPVPLDEAQGKVLYVWFDAPIGYISATEEWGIEAGEPDRWKKWWLDQNAKIVHFIGKDNIVFHTVVWQAILMADGRFPLPELVCGNEFLNLEGEKISTSRNFAIWASDAVKSVGADALRYYLTRISPETSDSNFTWSDFQTRVNGELADVFGNLLNRALSFLNAHFAGEVRPAGAEVDARILDRINETVAAYSAALEGGFSKQALESVVELGRFLNGYFQEKQPWKVKKTDPAEAHSILHSTIFGIKALVLLLYPVCPNAAQRWWEQLGFSLQIKESQLTQILEPFTAGHRISQNIQPVVQKIEDAVIASEKERLSQTLKQRI
ncbi:MAG: methionine--tRNA ligase [Oligoflexia bacterium]|nr:methionine--tRNA ligase [Oligoflexia bacterium]